MKHELEDLIKIGRIKFENKEEWEIFIKDLKTHDFDVTWVAGILFLILDRYSSELTENSQLEFQQDVLKQLSFMIEDGYSHISKH